MNKYIKYEGIVLLSAGVLLLAVKDKVFSSDNNGILLAALSLIAAGIIIHVAFMKNGSKY